MHRPKRRAKRLRQGGDLTIVTTGILVSEGLAAADELGREGLSVRVLHMPTVKPLDEQELLLAARETRAFITVEEHNVLGGLGEAVAAFLGQHCPRPLRRIGIQDVFGESGQASELQDRYGLRAVDIIREARALTSQAL